MQEKQERNSTREKRERSKSDRREIGLDKILGSDSASKTISLRNIEQQIFLQSLRYNIHNLLYTLLT